MIDPTNISYEQMVEAAKIYGAKVLSAGEQMKLNKQIEACKRLRGALRMTVKAIDAGKSYSPDDLRRALAAADRGVGRGLACLPRGLSFTSRPCQSQRLSIT